MPIRFHWPWRSAREIGADIDAEIRFHIDMRVAELMNEEGLAEVAARRKATEEFGDLRRAQRTIGRTDRAAEASRQRKQRLEDWFRDTSLAIRSLRHTPGFTAVALLTLGLGIGLTTTVFSVVNGVLLRPLPYSDPERLVTLWQLDTGKGEREKPSPANFLDWRDRSRSFAPLATAEPYGYTVLGEGAPVGVSAFNVSRGFFEALGAAPLIGRSFSPAEYAPGGPAVVVLSESIWRRRYGADLAIVGRNLNFEGTPYQVVGVAPGWLEYPSRADVYVPKQFSEAMRQLRAQTYYNVIGRLAPGVTIGQARKEMETIAATLAREYPRTNAHVTVPVVPLMEHVTGRARTPLLALLAAVGLVLLIGCVNVANLLLGRGLARRSELAVRAALGAGRGRIVRQLLVESGVLAVAGGGLGIHLSMAAIPLVVNAASAAGLPRVDAISIDRNVLGLALAATMITVLLAGAVPAWMLTGATGSLLLRGSGRGADAGSGARRTGRVLVTLEVAIALVLLVGASLLGRSLSRLVSEEMGFSTDNRLLLTTHFWDKYPKPEERTEFLSQVLTRIGGLPGVVSVGAGSALPLSLEGSDMDPPYLVDGRSIPAPGEEPTARLTVATPGYFPALGIRLLRGRLLGPEDRAESPAAVVVSETMARQVWPGEDPVGKRIISRTRGPAIIREVVGVVADVRHRGHDEALRPEYYVPHPQWPFGSMTIVIHTSGPPEGILEPAQREVWALQSELLFAGTETLEGLLAATLAVRRLILVTMTMFAGLAAVLAAMGIYGMVSLGVAQRTRELGVRMALGAEPGNLRALVLRQGLGLVLAGIAAGAVGAIALTRLIRGLLYGTTPTDPVSFAAAALALIATALVAGWIPARRATLVDPLTALKSD